LRALAYGAVLFACLMFLKNRVGAYLDAENERAESVLLQQMLAHRLSVQACARIDSEQP